MSLIEIEPDFTYYEIVSPLNEEYDPYAVIIDPDWEFDPERQVQQRMMLVLGAVMVTIILLAVFVLPRLKLSESTAVSEAQTAAADTAVADPHSEAGGGAPAAAPSVSGVISPVFSPEVRRWEAKILEWSAQFGLDPDITATIMQIESCGDPQAISSAGAQGLFQVMPFHFEAGEDSLHPDTNAYRGLSYFVGRMEQTGGDIGRSFAGYNGGHVAAGGSWDSWAPETQRYYVWSTGIYQEAKDGLTESPTLQKWMAAGGASLCQQAAQRLGLP